MMSSEGETAKRKLSVIQGDYTSGKQSGDSRCLTFVLEGEDHTFGNSLRYLIMKNPEVEFCGYNVPHPTESRINFRIQSRGPPAATILKQGIQDLSQVCDHVLATFEESVKEYKAESGEPMET